MGKSVCVPRLFWLYASEFTYNGWGMKSVCTKEKALYMSSQG